MHRLTRYVAPICALVLANRSDAQGTRAGTVRSSAAAVVSADTLRASLFAIADDSMGGRDTGSPGNVKAADWVAARFARYGLQPAGENGTWFQAIPFFRLAPDAGVHLRAGGGELVPGTDFLPFAPRVLWNAAGVRAIYAGVAGDSTSYPAADAVNGKLVVFGAPRNSDVRPSLALSVARRSSRFAGAAGFAIAGLDAIASDIIDQALQGGVSTDTMGVTAGKPSLFITSRAASLLLGADVGSAPIGAVGGELGGDVAWARLPLLYPARNVIAILPGSNPAVRGTYVSLSAHNDHVGHSRLPADHDSTRAFNRVVRPMGADSRMRDPTPEEAVRIARIRDSLRAAHPPKQDSVFNGADDDGSGTVALVELARVLAAGPRPRRSILFVSHAAEERGLLGSKWFTDHPTLARDSIVGEIDVDMIGRGGAADLPGGGPGYLEVVGSKRLSTEFGALLETVAGRAATPFRFNYEYDVAGHPLQYYCRADHFSYARYGIPSVSLSTGEHLDYHQVTDEAQYIDYDQLARVTALAQAMALAVGNLDHRPVVDGPRQDPHAPCRQ